MKHFKTYSFPSEKEISMIKTHVLREPNKNSQNLKKAANIWLKAFWENKLQYELTWLGVPIIQTPEDLFILQEIIFKTKPDIIIETGIAHGGSLIYYASLLELLGHGKVIGIDKEVRKHNRVLLEKHPLIKRITMLEGSSTDPAIFQQVKRLIPSNANVFVVLDSDHRRTHVLNELTLYSKLVSVGSYIVAEDTIMPIVAKYKNAKSYYSSDNALQAVNLFLHNNKNFVSDRKCEKLFFTYFPKGFLKRIS